MTAGVTTTHRRGLTGTELRQLAQLVDQAKRRRLVQTGCMDRNGRLKPAGDHPSLKPPHEMSASPVMRYQLGCRCDECRAHNTERNRNRRHAKRALAAA